MHLLFVSRYYHPDASGGYEMNCRSYAQELVRRGHEVTVLTRGDHPPVVDNGVRVWRRLPDVPPRTDSRWLRNRIYQLEIALANRRAASRMLAALECVKPAVIVFWGMNMYLVAPVVVARQSGIPHAFDIGDYWLLESLRSYDIRDSLRRRYREGLLGGSFTAGALRNVVVHSEFMRQQHVQAGIRSEEIAVIPRPLDEGFVAACAQAPRREEGAEELRLLYVGRLVPDKGVHRAIEALGALQSSSGPRLRLDIYGSGPPQYELELRTAIERLRGRCSAVLHGPVAAAALPAIYRTHDALVFPAVWDEPSSNVILEAAVAGLPVVATRSGSVAEYLGEDSAILVQKDDPLEVARGMETVAHDLRGARIAAARARERVLEQHNSQRVFDTVEAHLQRVATGSQAA
jgi:glycosyltransferase involved in cell wall biosynthesis